MNFFMGAMLLRDSDAVSMINSLEVRFPFLNRKFTEFLFSLPVDYLVKGNFEIEERGYGGNNLKMLLCDAFNDTLTPGFMDRKKTGFRLPYKNWLRHELKEILAAKIATDNPILDNKNLELMHRNWKSGSVDWKLMWKILILNSWTETYL